MQKYSYMKEHFPTYKINEILQLKEFGKEINLKGWVRTKRGNKQVVFIAVNDGSIIHNIQVVADPAKFDEEFLKQITTGSSISVNGILVESPAQGQPVEIQAKRNTLIWNRRCCYLSITEKRTFSGISA